MNLKKRPEVIIASVFFILVLFLSTVDTTLLWDENAYLGNARNLIGHSNYTEDFRFPLLGFIIAGVWSLTGESLIIAKLIVIIFSVLTVFVFYKISKKYLRGKYPEIATILFSFSYLILYWSFRVYTDIPAVFFILLSFHFFQHGTERKYILLSGISGGLAFLMKFPSFIFLFSVVLYLVYRREFKMAFIFSLGILIIIVPWMTYNYFQYHGDVIYDFKAQWDIVSRYTTPENPVKTVTNIFMTMNIMAIFVLLGLHNQIKTNWKEKKLILFYLLIFFIYLSFLTNMKIDRYLFPVLPFLYLLAADGLQKIGKYAYPIVTVSVIISLTLLSIHVSYSLTCGNGGPIEQSIKYVCPLNPEKVMSNFWPHFGWACNSKISSLWSPNLDELLDSIKPNYIVYSPQLGDQYNKTVLDSNKRIELEKTMGGTCGESVFIYKNKIV